MMLWFATMLIQASERQSVSSIWPHTVGEWGALLVQTIVIVGAVAGLLGRYLTQRLNGLGGRVALVEANQSEHTGALTVMKEKMQFSEFDRGALHEEIGRLAGVVDKYIEHDTARHDREAERDEDIRTRLTRIEERTSVAESIHELGEIVADAIRRSAKER